MHFPRPPPTTFHLFPDLPLELRLKIWQTSCNIPRTLTLTYSSENETFHCTTPPPSLLGVSHEARKEALRTYSFCFGTTISPPKICINPHHDILYTPRYREMGYDTMLRDLRSLIVDPLNILDQVRYIAVDHVNPEIKRPWESYNKASFIRSFPRLEEVVLVLGSKSESRVRAEEKVEMAEPNGNPESLLKIWYSFRQEFLMEEKMLEDVCRENCREYRRFELPPLRVRERVAKRRGEGKSDYRVKNIMVVLERMSL